MQHSVIYSKWQGRNLHAPTQLESSHNRKNILWSSIFFYLSRFRDREHSYMTSKTFLLILTYLLTTKTYLTCCIRWLPVSIISWFCGLFEALSNPNSEVINGCYRCKNFRSTNNGSSKVRLFISNCFELPPYWLPQYLNSQSEDSSK